jgi:hypothetical protein
MCEGACVPLRADLHVRVSACGVRAWVRRSVSAITFVRELPHAHACVAEHARTSVPFSSGQLLSQHPVRSNRRPGRLCHASAHLCPTQAPHLTCCPGPPPPAPAGAGGDDGLRPAQPRGRGAAAPRAAAAGGAAAGAGRSHQVGPAPRAGGGPPPTPFPPLPPRPRSPNIAAAPRLPLGAPARAPGLPPTFVCRLLRARAHRPSPPPPLPPSSLTPHLARAACAVLFFSSCHVVPPLPSRDRRCPSCLPTWWGSRLWPRRSRQTW